jgi:hypothetical protein
LLIPRSIGRGASTGDQGRNLQITYHYTTTSLDIGRTFQFVFYFYFWKSPPKTSYLKLIMSLHIKLESLQSVLSGAASVYLRDSPEFSSVALRWSEFAAPQPGAIVNVQTEEDVQRTVSQKIQLFLEQIVDSVQVQWALENGVKFVAQNGSHGWTIDWNISESDVIINMRGLNNVNVNLEEGVALVQGGALVHEVVEAAYEANAHIGMLIQPFFTIHLTKNPKVVGNCNSVGACGAMLGGGFSRLQANFSMSIDNIISLRLVTAQGELITVSETENSELLWAMKGAGHNFGIVTAALVKAYPQVNGGVHWESNMVFLPDHIEEVTQTINDLHLGTGMSIHYAFIGVDSIVGIVSLFSSLPQVTLLNEDLLAGLSPGPLVCRHSRGR